METQTPHLRTKYVFIDTQAFRGARFDWSGRALSKLAEFARQGHLRLLATDVTIREVKSQLKELLIDAYNAVNKHGGVLQQIGASLDIERDQTAALGKMEIAFEQFLERTNAIIVPMVADIKDLLDDYFARRPPFSSKKKAEFPDAITIASIRAWCEKNRATVYIVSDDADLQECCSEAGPLFHAQSLGAIISQATVSQELHEALENALRDSEYLREAIAEEIRDLDIKISRMSKRGRYINQARVEEVYSVEVTSLTVFEQQGQTFTCEPEIQAEVGFGIVVEIEEHDEYEYRPISRHHSTSVTKVDYFYPEIIVRFDRSTGELEFESISFGAQSIEVGPDDLDR